MSEDRPPASGERGAPAYGPASDYRAARGGREDRHADPPPVEEPPEVVVPDPPVLSERGGFRLSSGVRILGPDEEPAPPSKRVPRAEPARPKPRLPAIPPPPGSAAFGARGTSPPPQPPPPTAPAPPAPPAAPVAAPTPTRPRRRLRPTPPPPVGRFPQAPLRPFPEATRVALAGSEVALIDDGATSAGAPPAEPLAGDEEESSFSRNTLLMASGTLLSRVTGFGKVLALAWVLGVSPIGDAYNLANNMPNSIYDLVLGGVLSATLIPVFVEEMNRRNQGEGWRAISAVVSAVMAVLVVVSVVFWFVAPAIIDLLFVGVHGARVASERPLAVHLLRLFVPQLLFLGGIALTTALLNARRRFAVPAFSPILCNLVTVAAVLATGAVAKSLTTLSTFQRDETAILVLGLGTTAGYLVQLGAQLPSLISARVHLRPVWQPNHPAVRTVLRLSLWTLGAVVANQISFYVIQLLANEKGGSVSAFNYAYQFFQLPYAIFAVSIASVISPDLAQRWTSGQVQAFRARMAAGLRLTIAILVPAGIGYAIIAQPLLRLALRHGHVSVSQAHLTGTLVAIFALGLPGFSVFLFLMRGFQAMKDTRSMFWSYCLENGLTLVVGISLFPAFGVRGLVVGWVGAYTIAGLVGFAVLSHKTGGLQGSTIFTTAFRVVLASATMAIVLGAVSLVLPDSGSDLVLVVRVGFLAICGAVIYTLGALWLGVAEVRQVVTIRGGRRSNTRPDVSKPPSEGGP